MELPPGLLLQASADVTNDVYPHHISEGLSAQLQKRRMILALESVPDDQLAKRSLEEADDFFLEQHPETSILFADIVSYTKLSHAISPGVVMSLLHQLYIRFDTIAQTYDTSVYKVRTARALLQRPQVPPLPTHPRCASLQLDVIGDAYMACAGLRFQSQSKPAQALIEFARDMLMATSQLPHILHDGEEVRLQIRIGIATGPVASGLLGKVRRKFTCMGDTVNKAARLESSGVPMCVHMDRETLLAAGLDPGLLEERQVMLKGLGEVTTYLWRTETLDLPITPRGLAPRGGFGHRRSVSMGRVIDTETLEVKSRTPAEGMSRQHSFPVGAPPNPLWPSDGTG